jgi:hypothetical protein
VYQYEDVALNSQAVPEPVVNEVQVITTSTGAAALVPETQRIVISGVDQTVLTNNKVSFRFKALGNRYILNSYLLYIIYLYKHIVHAACAVVMPYRNH